jgi:hypothetical protein
VVVVEAVDQDRLQILMLVTLAVVHKQDHLLQDNLLFMLSKGN